MSNLNPIIPFKNMTIHRLKNRRSSSGVARKLVFYLTGVKVKVVIIVRRVKVKYVIKAMLLALSW